MALVFVMALCGLALVLLPITYYLSVYFSMVKHRKLLNTVKLTSKSVVGCDTIINGTIKGNKFSGVFLPYGGFGHYKHIYGLHEYDEDMQFLILDYAKSQNNR